MHIFLQHIVWYRQQRRREQCLMQRNIAMIYRHKCTCTTRSSAIAEGLHDALVSRHFATTNHPI